MPNALTGFFDEMINIVIDPVLNWIRNLKKISKFFTALSILGIVACIYWHQQVGNFFSNANQYFRILFPSQTSRFFSADAKEQLKSLIDDIETNLVTSEYPKKETNPAFYNPWTTSQIVVSSKGNNERLKNDYLRYIENSKALVRNCHCWSEFPDSSSFGNNITTAWIMISLAQYKTSLNDTLVDYVLKSQNDEGWWSLFPSTTEQDASTAATAWMVLALQNNLNNISPAKVDEAKQKITNGVRWLENQFSEANQFCFDYPFSGERKESIAINGLVVHVINKLEKNQTIVKQIDRYWLNHFEEYNSDIKVKGSDQYNITSASYSGHTLRLTNKMVQKDNINNYDVPWFIIASADAYHNAGFGTKAKILNLYTSIINQGNDLFTATMQPSPQPWIACEFLVSLRMINDEDIF